MTNRLTSNLPPSPTDHSSPTSRKETNLHINTKQNSHETTGTNGNNGNAFWKDPTSLFSPPLSPLTPAYQDRHLSSNTNRKKSQQQHQQQGSLSWQQTHWDNVDIEKLTLENAKLKRSNRLLKVDREDWLEKRIRPLDQHIRDLTVANVRWQRAAKLLQQDLIDSQQQLENFKLKQVTQMPWMGCEYQFLVDMIHQLQTQINGQTTRKERNSSARILTPSDRTSPSRETISNKTNINRQHQTQQHGSPMTTPKYLTTFYSEQHQNDWNELSVLVDRIQSLEHDLEDTLRQLSEKEQNEDRFKSELLSKDQMIQLLEKEYDELNNQVQTLRHKLDQTGATIDSTPLNNELAFMEDNFMMMTQDGIRRMENDITTDRPFTPNIDDDFDIEMDMDCDIDNDSFNLDGSLILETARDVDRLLPGGQKNKGSVSDGCQEDAATFDKLPCDLSSVAGITASASASAASASAASAAAAASAATEAAATLLPPSSLEESLAKYKTSSSGTTITATSYVDHRRTLSSGQSSTSTATTGWDQDTSNRRWTMCSSSLYSASADKRFSTTSTLFTLDSTTSVSLPGAYPRIMDFVNTAEGESMDRIDKTEPEWALMVSSLIMGHEPFAPFVMLTFLLGVSTKIGIKDDWLIPITLLALCSGYLWTGAFRGIHIKVNF